MTAFSVPLGAPVPPCGAIAPDGRSLTGRYCRLEKLSAAAHGDALWACAQVEPVDRWAYLGEVGPFDARAPFDEFLRFAETSPDPYFYAVLIDGEAKGWASLMRHDIPNAVIEVGYIWLSAQMARSAASTEAMYLLMKHAFDDLSMRRYEWKCNALNAPSCAAAKRLGFTPEGVFRQHQITRGLNRDTAWFSILDQEWAAAKAAFEQWLEPTNFDENGQQKRSLASLRGAHG